MDLQRIWRSNLTVPRDDAPADYDRFLTREQFLNASDWQEQQRFFKLECLEYYPEDMHSDAFKAFERGDLSRASTELDGLFADAGKWFEHYRQRGALFQRVRVYETPLTVYAAFELEAYERTVAVGEDVRLIEASKVASCTKSLSLQVRDFIIMDNTVYVHGFDQAYEHIGSWEISDPHTVQGYVRLADKLLALAKPFSLTSAKKLQGTINLQE